MQGLYSTKHQRVQKAQQIGKTHFQLGSHSNEYTTTFTDSFKWKNQTSASQLQTKLGRSNFQIGTGQSKSKQTSEFIDKYRPHQISVEARVSVSKNKHHFNLGKESGGMSTTSTVFHQHKITALQASNYGKHLRKHNFALGNDPVTKASSFVSAYTKYPVERQQNNAKLKADIGQTHFTLGNDPRNFISASSQSYTLKQKASSDSSKQLIKDLKSSHFELGTQKPLLRSTSQNYFTAKSLQEANKQIAMKLRQSHIHLGPHKPEFIPVSHQNYQYFPPKTAQGVDNKLRKSNFRLGEENKSSWTSMYAQQHRSMKMITNEKARNFSADFGNQLTLGNDPKIFGTTSNTSYQMIKKLSRDKKAQGRNTSFELGQNRRAYQTTYGELGKGEGEKIQQNSNIANQSHITHFVCGNDPPAYMTNFRKDYSKKEGKPQRINGDLRRQHFSIGEGAGRWGTEQKKSYKWIQPVPDEQ